MNYVYSEWPCVDNMGKWLRILFNGGRHLVIGASSTGIADCCNPQDFWKGSISRCLEGSSLSSPEPRAIILGAGSGFVDVVGGSNLSAGCRLLCCFCPHWSSLAPSCCWLVCTTVSSLVHSGAFKGLASENERGKEQW